MNVIVIHSLIFVAIVLCDQLFKIVAPLYQDGAVGIVTKMISITSVFTVNKGFSFGFGGSLPAVCTIAVTILLLLIVISEIVQRRSLGKDLICETVILAGGVSNLIDRLLYGHVRDYIAVTIFGLDMPIFNLADCAIVIGVCLLLIRENYLLGGRLWCVRS